MGETANIPKGWIIVPLEDVCQICDNLRKPVNSDERLKRIAGKKPNELYPYYGATGLVGYIDDYLTDGEYVLLGEDGAPFLSFGKDVAYMINGKTWVNNHAHILLSYFSNKYLMHYLNQVDYRSYVSGTTRLKLTQASMKKIPIRLAPLEEQNRIVAKIEELFSNLDKGIERLKAAQQQLKIYRQSVLKWAFEGRFTSQSVKEGSLIDGWRVFKLEEITLKIQIGPFGTQLHREDYIENGIPLINPMHIQNGQIIPDAKYTITQKKKETLAEYILREGDIILGRRGEMGRCALVQTQESGWLCGTGSLYIRPSLEILNSKFLYYFLSSETAKKYLEENAAGTTMANLNSQIINRLPIELPPLNEQQKIVKEIESRLSICDKMEEIIAQNLQLAEALRQSILKKAFAGKLVTQDLNDEPDRAMLKNTK